VENMEQKTFFVTDANGNDIEYEIVLTFESPKTGKSYVVYKELGETEDVMAAIYNEKDGMSGELIGIETEEEFQMIQEVLDAFTEEEE
jgi:uncharacterized protein YrzB (UPF0473 family)